MKNRMDYYRKRHNVDVKCGDGVVLRNGQVWTVMGASGAKGLAPSLIVSRLGMKKEIGHHEIEAYI